MFSFVASHVSVDDTTNLSGTINLSGTKCWSTNATTVLGSPSGSSGSILPLIATSLGIRMADDENTLFVADHFNDRIIMVRLNSSFNSSVFAQGRGGNVTQMFKPADVFPTAKYVHVMDNGNFRVVKWLRNGSNPVVAAGITGTSGTSLATLSSSFFIFVDQYDNLYVSDTYNQRVLRFNSSSVSGANGINIAGTGSSGAGNNQFNMPNGIFVDSNGTLYVADFNNQRIQRWFSGASSGTRVAGSGIAGCTTTQLNKPTSVVVDSDGYIYVTELQCHRVTRWAPNATSGVCIAACTGVYGVGPNQLNAPQALEFDSVGALYVSDQSNNRVQQFRALGACGKYPLLTTVNLLLPFPETQLFLQERKHQSPIRFQRGALHYQDLQEWPAQLRHQ